MVDDEHDRGLFYCADECGRNAYGRIRTANMKTSRALTIDELEQAKVLAASGKSYRKIGRELGRSDKTVKKALTRTPEIVQDVARIREELALQFEDVAKRMITSITDEDITRLDGYRRTLSAGIAVDKAASLRNAAGQAGSTEIRILIVGNDGSKTAVAMEMKPQPKIGIDGGDFE